jgi:hypothetical protein
MKHLIRSALFASWFVLLASTASAQWANVGVGIDYQALTITMGDGNHNNLFLARMAVANTNCIMNSMIASNRVAAPASSPAPWRPVATMP